MNYHTPISGGALTDAPLTALMDFDRLGRDIHYMKQYYPRQVLRLAEITELVADRYDTPRSFFYDEFPDRISMLHILKEITDAYRTEQTLSAANREANATTDASTEMDAFPAKTTGTSGAPFLPDEEAASAIAELLLLQEILLRRLRRREHPRRPFSWRGLGF